MYAGRKLCCRLKISRQIQSIKANTVNGVVQSVLVGATMQIIQQSLVHHSRAFELNGG